MASIKNFFSGLFKTKKSENQDANFPSNVKLRIYLKLPSELYRKFYWVEMDKDDFYWGKAQQGRIYTKRVDSNSEGGISITIPDNIDDAPVLQVKESYHASGEVHTKTQNGADKPNYIKISKWAKKDQIEKPIRLLTMFTATIETYDQMIEQPKIKEHKHEYAITIDLDESSLKQRLYVEFYLAPEGQYSFAGTGPRFFKDEDLQYFTFKMSKKLIFICRFNVNNQLEGFREDVALSLLIDKFSSDAS